MKDTAPTEALPRWTVDDEGCHVIRTRDCWVWMQARPAYCDRGRWLAHVEVAHPRLLDVDAADRWPRYYFDLERAKAEVEAWLRVRKQIL